MNVWLEAGRRYAVGIEWNGATEVVRQASGQECPAHQGIAPARASIVGALSFDAAKGTQQPLPDATTREATYLFALELAE